MTIYAIVNLRTQRAYIGRTARVQRRWYEHQHGLRSQRHPSKQLQADWNRDGAEWFSFVTLEELPASATKSEAAARETWYLESTIEPYNQSRDTLSGPAPGYVVSKATRAKISAATKGQKRSAETRRRISAARTGRRFGPRTRGYTLSAETKEKMRQAHLGLKGTPESRAKQSAALKGRVFTQAWKDKIRAAKTGKPWSLKRREAHLAVA